MGFVMDEKGRMVFVDKGDGVRFAICGRDICDRQKLVEAIIPEGVNHINAETFKDCVNLKKVVFPSTLKWIWESAFENCVALTEIEIPESVTSIMENAFRNTGLKKVYLPKEVVTGKGAFSDCRELTEINTGEENQYDDCCYSYSIDGILYNRAYGVKNLICCPCGYDRNEGVLKIPEGVRDIAEDAFVNTKKLNEITIPGSIRVLRSHAFYGSFSPEKIILNGGVEQLNQEAFVFEGFSDKTVTVEVPRSIKKICDDAFKGNVNIVVNVHNPDAEIGDHKCPNVKFNIFNPLDKDKYIIEGDTLVRYISNGESEVTVPDGIKVIGDGAFANSDSLQKIYLPDGLKEIRSGVCSGVKDVSIPDSVEFLGDGAFSFSEIGEEITLPKSLKNIGKQIFHYCKKLKRILIDDENPCFKSVDGVLYSKDGTELFIALNRETLYIGAEVRAIAEDGIQGVENVVVDENNPYFCSYCGSLYNKERTKVIFHNYKHTLDIRIPSYVTDFFTAGYGDMRVDSFVADDDHPVYKTVNGIVYSKDMKKLICCPCFKKSDYTLQCRSGKEKFIFDVIYNTLDGVRVEDGVEIIGEKAFKDLWGINIIKLPNSVVEIQDSAFEGCRELINIELSDNLRTIGSNAFGNCVGLEKLFIPASVTDIARNAIVGGVSCDLNHLRRVDVDRRNRNYYSVDGMLFDKNNVLLYCADISKEIVIPEGTVDIKYDAFNDLDSYYYCVERIIMPKSLKKLNVLISGDFEIVIKSKDTEISEIMRKFHKLVYDFE